MSEVDFKALHSNEKVLAPEEAHQILRTIGKSVNSMKDHVVVDLVWTTLKKMEASAAVAVTDSNPASLQESASRIPYKDLKMLIESGISPIQKLVYKLDEMGFTSLGKELEIKIKLETIADILSRLNKMTCVVGRSDKATWSVQERIDKVTEAISCQLQVDYRYKNRPKGILWTDRLWHKLSRTSVKEIKLRAVDEQCSKCSNLIMDMDFAILDACNDIFCTDCAHRSFNKPEESLVACPVCQSQIRIYTLASDLHNFIRSTNTASIFRSLTKSIFSKKNENYVPI